MAEHDNQVDIHRILEHMHNHAAHLSGSDATAGFQIAGLIRILANLYDNIRSHESSGDLSGPRMGLLVRLFEEERHGNTQGITPTELSRNQHVSRNTISALLRGLEDQGYIERLLDPDDRRLFHIHLSDAGREAVSTLGPERVAITNQLAAKLSLEEQEQLIELLAKLFELAAVLLPLPGRKRGN